MTETPTRTVTGPPKIQSDLSYRHRHLPAPDYSRPLLEVPEGAEKKIRDYLSKLYEGKDVESIYGEVLRLMRVYWATKTDRMIEDDADFDPRDRFTQMDSILITYGDLVLSPDKPPLRVLDEFLGRYFGNLTTVHLLPFFPYSSDRGFSVTNYEAVDPNLGTWEDVMDVGDDYQLMFDGVINHISAQSEWFQEFLNGNPDYQDVFTAFTTSDAIPPEQLKLILRPRSTELLTPYQTLNGLRFVWTTFSKDQVDLNYRNPKVFTKILDVLLYYVWRGADLIRMDAATYLWFELGTSSAHLWQTHAMIQCIRAVFDVICPRVAIITETNVPHRDNISYFGDGTNEAQMVYNFALPPLVVYSFYKEDCTILSKWAATLDKVSDQATYFNFLDSHDGIGLLPIKDLVPEREVEMMIRRARDHGGLVSYRRNEEGEKSPYELNITWWNALNREDGRESLEIQVDRFIASRAIALTLRGVPGIYIAGMFGGQNDWEAVEATGEARAINRRAVDVTKLIERLEDPDSHSSRIFRRMNYLLGIRAHNTAFDPNGDQKIIHHNSSVFSVLRTAPEGDRHLLALINVTASATEITLSESILEGAWPATWRDLLSGREVTRQDGTLVISLSPYEVLWLEPAPTE